MPALLSAHYLSKRKHSMRPASDLPAVPDSRNHVASLRGVHCFEPIEDNNASILIVGSIPGQMSLHAGEYYAHPRNAFWPIMSRLLGFNADASYPSRTSALKMARIAVWDVVKSCIREGSLDANIDSNSLVINDFTTFFSNHPHIMQVCFNGTKAQTYYKRFVLKQVNCSTIRYSQLPSTSPANAAISLEEKFKAWQMHILSDR